MSGSVLHPAVAAALGSLGFGAEDQAVRDQAPTAARNNNLALAWPPAACYAAPALAGMVTAQASGKTRSLVLVPQHALPEWAAVILPLAEAAGLTAMTARTSARAMRRLLQGQLDLLVTTPATALQLLERSALKADQLGHVVLAWPEQFEGDDPLAALMHDLPTEAQRILILADPRPNHPLLERYARRAPLSGPLANLTELESVVRPSVRVAVVPWVHRAAALGSVLELEDPASVTVWCADAASASAACAALATGDHSVRVTTSDPPKASLIIAWDLPTPARLTELRALGDLVLLAPPHAAAYLRQFTARQSPVRLPGAVETARDEAASRRAAVQAELERGGLDGELLALAPLFAATEAALVAAGLYRLWRQGTDQPPAPAEAIDPRQPARIWISAGKKDGTTAADLVAVLNRDVGMAAGRIGRIEIREMFSLVEVPAGEAEDIARRLSGKMVRRRTVKAKVDDRK